MIILNSFIFCLFYDVDTLNVGEMLTMVIIIDNILRVKIILSGLLTLPLQQTLRQVFR